MEARVLSIQNLAQGIVFEILRFNELRDLLDFFPVK